MIPTTKTTPSPLFLTYENVHWYLTLEGHSYTLRNPSQPMPLFQVQDPLLWIQGIMTSPQSAHLIYLKNNGELCYTVISPAGSLQTTILDKLDIRSNRYTRPILLVVEDKVHIFYGYSYQGIADMWVIEHRFWNGKSWRTARLGESFHPKEPLYHITVDEQKNIHFLSMTFQGRQSLMFSNRFHGVFHIWGNPVETMTFSGEVVDMTAVMTSDNVHHLFWVIKNLNGIFEVRWAQRSNAYDFTSTWTTAPAPIRNFTGPWKRISVIELNGCLWLLAHAKEENLMLYEGQGWKFVSSLSFPGRPLQWIRTTTKGFQYAPWVQDQSSKLVPLFAKEIGLQNYSTQPLKVSLPQPTIHETSASLPTKIEMQNILSHPELHHLLSHPQFKEKYSQYPSTPQTIAPVVEIVPQTSLPEVESTQAPHQIDSFQSSASQVKISQASVAHVKIYNNPTPPADIPVVPTSYKEVLQIDLSQNTTPEAHAIQMDDPQHIEPQDKSQEITLLRSASQDFTPQRQDSLDALPQSENSAEEDILQHMDFQVDIPPISNSPEASPQGQDPAAPSIQEYMAPFLQSMETLGQENRSMTRLLETLILKFDQSIHSFEKLEQQLKSWNISKETSQDLDKKERGILGRWFS